GSTVGGAGGVPGVSRVLPGDRRPVELAGLGQRVRRGLLGLRGPVPGAGAAPILRARVERGGRLEGAAGVAPAVRRLRPGLGGLVVAVLGLEPERRALPGDGVAGGGRVDLRLRVLLRARGAGGGGDALVRAARDARERGGG